MGVAVLCFLHGDVWASGLFLKYAYRVHKIYLSGIMNGG